MEHKGKSDRLKEDPLNEKEVEPAGTEDTVSEEIFLLLEFLLKMPSAGLYFSSHALT
jgi:hypothetical protein